jgi:hypothetical protein
MRAPVEPRTDVRAVLEVAATEPGIPINDIPITTDNPIEAISEDTSM